MIAANVGLLSGASNYKSGSASRTNPQDVYTAVITKANINLNSSIHDASGT
jgi:hypothetical protein